MAQKVITVLTDDTDGTVIERGQGETITFGVDGALYEIDLSADNAAALRDAIAPYIKVGRRAGASSGTSKSTGGRRKSGSAGTSASKNNTQAVREWAKANSLEVSERGRISGSLRAQFSAAQN
jgi:hypothetical protein